MNTLRCFDLVLYAVVYVALRRLARIVFDITAKRFVSAIPPSHRSINLLPATECRFVRTTNKMACSAVVTDLRRNEALCDPCDRSIAVDWPLVGNGGAQQRGVPVGRRVRKLRDKSDTESINSMISMYLAILFAAKLSVDARSHHSCI